MTDSYSSNGASRYQTDKVRVAIIGVGNCASSFVQGVQFYKDADPNEAVPGPHARGPRRLSRARHRVHGGLRHIDADKVGKDLSEAIWAGQNNTIKFADVPRSSA